MNLEPKRVSEPSRLGEVRDPITLFPFQLRARFILIPKRDNATCVDDLRFKLMTFAFMKEGPERGGGY